MNCKNGLFLTDLSPCFFFSKGNILFTFVPDSARGNFGVPGVLWPPVLEAIEKVEGGSGDHGVAREVIVVEADIVDNSFNSRSLEFNK